MRPRRVALTLVVALSAATGGVGATAARASSGSTICVALVVDGRTLGSDVSASCAKVSKGSTGIDVLQAAGHRVTFRNDGLLCTIDGLPRSGCADVDDTHYWAYFHRAPGHTGWTYSNEGASTYQPVNASTEGWVYDDGTAQTPDNVPYSQICAPKPKPSATPSATASRHPTHPPSAPPRHRSAPSTSASASATPTPSRSPRHHHKKRYVSTGLSLTARPLHTTPSPSSAALTGGSPPPSDRHGAVDLIIGLLVVAGLGGLAALRFRRGSR